MIAMTGIGAGAAGIVIAAASISRKGKPNKTYHAEESDRS
jgi:hypothetical protein